MDRISLPNLQRTAEALSRRDREVPALWGDIDALASAGTLTNAGFWSIHDQIERIEESVGIVFGEDTADRNDPETCRKCVRAGEPTPPAGQQESKLRQWVREWKQTSDRAET